MKNVSLALAGLLVASIASAQAPAPSRGKASATVGGKAVSVDYGIAKLNNRTLDALMKDLPADRMWRAGRNQVTTITTEGPLMIGTTNVPAGKYSLYVHVGADSKYSLAVNKNLGIALKEIFPAARPEMANEPWPHYTDYAATIGKEEIARVALTATTAAAPQDAFSITLTQKGADATLALAWGDKVFSTDLKAGK